MKLKKNYILPVLSVLFAVILSAFYLTAEGISSSFTADKIIFVLMSIVYVTAFSFIKEEWLYKAAAPLFAVFIVISAAVIIFGGYRDIPYGYRYVTIGSVIFSTLTALPLSVCFIARLIASERRLSLKRLFMLLALVALILAILILETHNHPFVICVFAGIIVYIMMCKDNRIAGPAYNRLWAPLICIVCVALFFLTAGSYTTERIMLNFRILFDRENVNYMSEGFTRTVYDSVISSAGFIGECDYTEAFEMRFLEDSHLLLILMKFGWVAAVGVLISLAVLLVLMWKMTLSIKNKAFARYVSLISVSVLTVQAVYSVISLFFLSYTFIDIPFAGCSKSINYISFILLGFVVLCYINKDKTSSIKAVYYDNLIPLYSEEEVSISDDTE